MSNRKIRKLTDMIENGKKDVEELEERLRKAKEKADKGHIDKAQFTKARLQLSEGIRGKRTMIARWEKARLNEERKLREAKEEEEEEKTKRKELRAERRREREKEKRRQMRAEEGQGDEEEGGGEAGDEDEGEEDVGEDMEEEKQEHPGEKKKKRGFFSFFR